MQLNTKRCKTGGVVITEGLAVNSCFELVKLPDLQIMQRSEHRNVTDQFGARAKQRVNKYPTLRHKVAEAIHRNEVNNQMIPTVLEDVRQSQKPLSLPAEFKQKRPGVNKGVG